MSGKDGQSKQALTTLLAKYAAFFDRGAQPLCILDPSGNCLAANDSCCELLGRPPGQLTGCLADWLADASEGQELLAQLAAAAAGAGLSRRAWGFRHEDGTSHSLWLSGVVERQGRKKFLIGFPSPAEAPAEAGPELPYRTLVNDLPVVTYTARLDSTSTTMFISPQVEQMLGYKPEEVVFDPEFWTRQLHPEDQAAALARLARCRISGEPFECEYRMRTREGRYVWVEDKAAIVRDERGGPYLQGVMVDVSDQKKAQEELAVRLAYEQMLAEVSADAVSAADLDGFIEATLRRLGETTDVSRVYLFRLLGGRLRNTHEWAALGVPPEKDNLQDEDPAATPYWMGRMEADEAIAAHVADMPEAERAVLEPQGIISILAVPLFIRGVLSGFVGFDECRRRRIWAPHDIGLLRTAVRLVASAIERKDAEAALRIKDSAIASSINAVAIIDLECNLTYVNSSFLRLWRYGDSKEVLGRSVLEFWRSPAQAVEVLEALRNRGSWVGELVARRRDGTQFSVQLLANLVTDEAGNPVCMMASFVDITERKRAEAALRESEKNYRQLLENASEGVWVIDAEARTTYANPRMAEMLGYTVEEMLGKSLFRFMDERGVSICHHCLERRKQGIQERHEFEFLRKDETPIYTTLATWPTTDRDGNYLGAVAFVADITERKRAEAALRESEARYRAIVEDQTEFITRFAPDDWMLTFVNEACCRFFGKKREELIGCSLLSYVAPEDRERLKGLLASLSQDSPVASIEHRVLLSGGEVRWHQWTNRAVFDGQGKLSEFQAVGRDITERKRAEEALAESERRYAALVDNALVGVFRTTLKGEFLYANQAMAEISGYERPEEMQGVDVHSFWREPGRRQEFLAELKAKGRVSNFEIDGQDRHGRRATVLISASQRDGLIEGMLMDITERKRAEEALGESEERFRNLMEHVPGVSIQGYGTDGTVFYWNKASEEVYGYSAVEAIGENLGDLIIPEEVKPHFRKALELGKKLTRSGEFMPPGELMLLHKDGSLVPVYSIHTAVCLEGREPLLFCIDVDLSERKRAEEALRESERFLSSIFASIQDCLVVLDGELNIVRVNPAGERYLSSLSPAGRRGMPLVGQKCYMAYHGRSEPCERCPSLRTLKTGEPAREIIPKRLPGGGVGWLELHTFPLVDQATGQAKGVVEYGRDVTERKLAEEALAAARREAQRHAETLAREQRLLEAVFENTQTLLAYLDRDFNFVRVNDAYARAAGRSKEELIGRNHFEFYPSEAEEIFKQVRESGQPYEAIARPFTYRDHPEWGETYWDWTLIPIKDAEGQVDGFVFSLVDVTARVRQQRELEEASQLKDEFLSMASHELKTPVTSIKIFSELASRRPEVMQPKLMVTLNRQADQLVRLVNDLLDVSRLQHGRMPVEMRRFDLASFLHELCERSRAVYENHHLVCRITEGPAVVSGDPARLEQVFQNLIDNAAKYSPEGGTIALEGSLEPKGAITLSVRDEGIGIAPEHLPHIFERFYKPSAQQAVYPGLGVGLFISKQIVEGHGGRIWAESDAAGGSAFHVRLPLASKD